MADARLTDAIAPAFYGVHEDMCKGAHAEYWLKGGRGSCKSSFFSVEIILGILKDADANAIVYRRVGNTLKDSVFEQLVWAIDKLGLTAYFRCKLSPLEIIYRPTGQRIIFRGADDPMKSKSIKLSKGYFKYLWFEELAEFRGMDDVRTIKQSVLRGVDQAYTLYSYNPPRSGQSWVNGEALADRPDRLVHHSTYLDVPRDWLKEAFYIEAEALKASSPMAYEHAYLGKVTGNGGAVFENLTIREITDEEIKGFGATYAGLDFGWFPDPLHFARCAYSPASRRLWVYDEYRTNKTSNLDAFRNLTECKGLTAAEEVIADSAEQKSVADMRSYGMRCVGATKGPGSVRASMKWLQERAEIIIDPVRCPNAAKEFQAYEYETARDGSFVDAFPDANNHSIDAVRYALNRVWLQAGK